MRRPFTHSGAVPLDAFYVEREADDHFLDAVKDVEGGPIHLHGSRQSGKSSLLLRTRAALAADHAVAYVDLAALYAVAWNGEVEFGQRLVSAVADELGEPAGAWHEHAGRDGLTRALIALCRVPSAPVILLFDELDSLPGDFKRELCRALRSLCQARARHPDLVVNVSLCGVEPPLGHFNGAASREGLEPVGGRQLWLEDLPVDDKVADRFSARFGEYGLDVPRDVSRAIVTHGGGYPQACTWLGNLVYERWHGTGLTFDQDFGQRLRELTRRVFDPAATTAWSDRQQSEMGTQWMRVIEAFLLEHGTTVREAIDVYRQVLRTFDGPGDPVGYAHGMRSHELLRTAGLARLSSDGRLRLRSPLFADAFDRSWIDRVEQLPDVRARYFGRRRGAMIDKRLLIIGTGGTIGMAEERRGRVAPPSRRAEWFRAVEELVTSVEFDSRFNLDSADVGPLQWSEIVRTIVRRQREFDGVVVAHGTDTMAYSASAVAFALGRDLGFPVVFTGSQTTVDVPHGDALANVLRASLVASEEVPEVVISFGEKVFRATRTQKKDDRRFDGFESPGYPELGFVAEEVQIFRQNVLAKPSASTLLTNVPMEFASGILHVSQLPGSEARFYEAALDVRGDDGDTLCRGIVIQSLGAGNVPTKAEEFDLTRLIRAATDRHIPVVLTSQYPVLPANYLRYSPSQAAIEAGAIPTGNMTISAVVTKLSWILPQVDHEIRQGMLVPERRRERVGEMMGQEYVGEGGLTVVDDPRRDDG